MRNVVEYDKERVTGYTRTEVNPGIRGVSCKHVNLGLRVRYDGVRESLRL